jgi:hypothetical protein
MVQTINGGLSSKQEESALIREREGKFNEEQQYLRGDPQEGWR